MSEVVDPANDAPAPADAAEAGPTPPPSPTPASAPPDVKDANFPYSLNNAEINWSRIQPHLEGLGYRLRPRYHPGWVGSWVGSRKRAEACEDSIGIAPASVVLDAVRMKDGRQVLLKLWNRDMLDGPELDVLQYFSDPARASDPANHIVPLFDLLKIAGWERSFDGILVEPLLREWSEPPFIMVAEALSFIIQLLEGLEYMHSHNVAHGDIHSGNILMDPAPIFPNGFHGAFNLNSDRRVSEKHVKRLSRIHAPVKYYYIDFGSSSMFPSTEERALTAALDPFKMDIYALGLTLIEEMRSHSASGQLATSASSRPPHPVQRPLQDPRWTKKRQQMLREWVMPESTMEEIVLMAASKTSDDEEILQLLKQAPIPPREAAIKLAYSMPYPVARSNLRDQDYYFEPSKIRLLRLAYHKDSPEASRAGLLLASRLAHSRATREEAVRILDQMIRDGHARAYATKALCYQKDWEYLTGTEKKRLATIIEATLHEGMKHRDVWCARELGGLLWQGRILRRDREKAKECWLQCAEWTNDERERLRTLSEFAGAIMPRYKHTPWRNNPDADASMCLQYTFETVGEFPDSTVGLGLFYYLRPDMSREDHMQIWTMEPDDTMAAEYFVEAIEHGNQRGQFFLAEMLLWNRATVPENVRDLVFQRNQSAEEAGQFGEEGRHGAEADQSVVSTSHSQNDPADFSKDVIRNDERNTRRDQLNLAHAFLEELRRYPRKFPTATPLLTLCKRLLKDLQNGGAGLPGESDLQFLSPPSGALGGTRRREQESGRKGGRSPRR
ncbi:hypothetical protein CALVIDRAFT_599508 [Calocera viscosa TUFC12733]|uniref:Protein kinase domain-containing protein n=1 Tax=Calocera viscosa (strain TUFC12733) TaxID=1330018 RepID=A0A167KVN2_CALVF|nr:hypothetical protein CALVIDRAFT_599508 [Calocera viscosa TUFC12733]